MYKKLPRSFFEKPTLNIARELLGKYLVVHQGKNILAGKIVETEAYVGEDDLACHASKGRTKRTETLYAKAGTLYVYMVYGMYYCLNIVTEKKDFPSAVLIRAVEPAEGIEQMRKARGTHALHHLASGPGKLCMAFGIGKAMNGENIFGKEIYIEDRGEQPKPKDIAKTKRIGVDYAKHCKNYPWRFYSKGSSFISKT